MTLKKEPYFMFDCFLTHMSRSVWSQSLILMTETLVLHVFVYWVS